MQFLTEIGLFPRKDICFRIDDPGYKPGDIIPAGRWGRIVTETGPTHQQYAREMLLESIREKEFATLPSRLTCSFAFKYFNDADHMHELRWNEGARQLMYTTVPVDSTAARHFAYMSCLPPLSGFPDEEIARAYWQGERYAFGCDFHKLGPTEILYACSLLVVAVNSEV